MILGWLISILTFPGVIVHEWAHKKFCDWFGVKVIQVKYFRLGNPAGYVLHEELSTFKQSFWISIGPLIINSLVAICFSFLTSQFPSESFIYNILFWIAISSGMHSFPSDHDMQNIAKFSKQKINDGQSVLYYLALPFTWIVWVANKLSFFWLDLIYALFLISIGSNILQ